MRQGCIPAHHVSALVQRAVQQHHRGASRSNIRVTDIMLATKAVTLDGRLEVLGLALESVNEAKALRT